MDLTGQMLAYVGMGRFAVARVDLSRLVQKKAELLRAMVARTITLNLHLSSEPLITQADAGQLEQVVMNLITNASEAIAEQPERSASRPGARIVMRLSEPQPYRAEPPAGRFVFIEVTDTGCGMDEQTQQRLFDPFYTTKFTGRGLGMSATLGIVRGHRGAIILESAPGVGTSIRLLFPAFREQGGTRESDPEAPSVPSGSRSHARTVLIADDEDAVREVAAAFIESLGFRTITAADGEEALRLFKEHAHQLACVLLDLTMPRMDGVSAFREMKRIQSEIPIILCSGYTEREATERFTDKGLAGFIQKPYRLQQLQEQLERAQKGLRRVSRSSSPGAEGMNHGIRRHHCRGRTGRHFCRADPGRLGHHFRGAARTGPSSGTSGTAESRRYALRLGRSRRFQRRQTDALAGGGGLTGGVA